MNTTLLRIAAAQPSADVSPSIASQPAPGALGKPARRFTTLATWTCAAVIVASLGARLVTWASGALIDIFFSTMALGQAASLPVTPAADAAILKVAEAYRKAVLEADAAGVAALYRDDAIEIPPFQAAIAGRAAIEQFYRRMFKGPVRVTGFTFTHSETTAGGDIGYEVGTYKRTMSGVSAGPAELVGTYVVILKRTGGEWKVAYITYTCDCPPPAPCATAAAH